MIINQILVQFKEVSLNEDQINNIKAAVTEIVNNSGIEVEYLFCDCDAF
jgi:hypothetical protein